MFNPITTGNRIAVGAPLQWIKHVYLGGQSPEISTQAESGGTTKATYLMIEMSWEVILCQLVNSYRIASHTSTPRMTTQNVLPFSYTIVITSDLTTHLLQYKHNIPNTAPVHQKCTKDMNTQRCNKKKEGSIYCLHTLHIYNNFYQPVLVWAGLHCPHVQVSRIDPFPRCRHLDGKWWLLNGLLHMQCL